MFIFEKINEFRLNLVLAVYIRRYIYIYIYICNYIELCPALRANTITRKLRQSNCSVVEHGFSNCGTRTTSGTRAY
jgi:hypothetical protein